MRTCLPIVAIALCVSVHAQNVRVSDYHVPISQATTLRFDGNWNYSQIGDTVASNNATGVMIFRKFYSSLPLAWFVNLDAAGGKSFKDYTYSVKTELNFKKYVGDDQNWFGSTNFTASKKGAFPVVGQTQQLASDITFGIGYGRYIKTTPLAKAVRIEDHLLKENMLSDYLPKQTMIDIANIIEREDEYKAIYREVYENAWMRDIENEMQKTDQLKDGSVSALGFQRMRQVLFGVNERVNERYYGWDLTSGFLFVLTNADRSPVGSPNYALVGRYSLPISWSIQLNSTAQVFTPMDTLAFDDMQTRANVDFIFELSNRVNILSQYIYTYIRKNVKNANAVNEISHYFAHDLNMSFLYYVENNVYLTYTINYNKEKGQALRFTTNLGVQYNLF
jgi:hypothetical protein